MGLLATPPLAMRMFQISLLLLTACSSLARSPEIHEFPRSTVFPGTTFDEVWSSTVAVFGDQGWPITTIEKASGLIATDWMQILDRELFSVLDCGVQPGQLSSRGVRFNVVVRNVGDSPELIVNSFYRAQRCTDRQCYPIECTSTGLWERDLMQAVREQVY